MCFWKSRFGFFRHPCIEYQTHSNSLWFQQLEISFKCTTPHLFFKKEVLRSSNFSRLSLRRAQFLASFWRHKISFRWPEENSDPPSEARYNSSILKKSGCRFFWLLWNEFRMRSISWFQRFEISCRYSEVSLDPPSEARYNTSILKKKRFGFCDFSGLGPRRVQFLTLDFNRSRLF